MHSITNWDPEKKKKMMLQEKQYIWELSPTVAHNEFP